MKKSNKEVTRVWRKVALAGYNAEPYPSDVPCSMELVETYRIGIQCRLFGIDKEDFEKKVDHSVNMLGDE